MVTVVWILLLDFQDDPDQSGVKTTTTKHQKKATTTTKNTRTTKEILTKTKVGELSLPILETCYKASYKDGMVLV